MTKPILRNFQRGGRGKRPKKKLHKHYESHPSFLWIPVDYELWASQIGIEWVLNTNDDDVRKESKLRRLIIEHVGTREGVPVYLVTNGAAMYCVDINAFHAVREHRECARLLHGLPHHSTKEYSNGSEKECTIRPSSLLSEEKMTGQVRLYPHPLCVHNEEENIVCKTLTESLFDPKADYVELDTLYQYNYDYIKAVGGDWRSHLYHVKKKNGPIGVDNALYVRQHVSSFPSAVIAPCPVCKPHRDAAEIWEKQNQHKITPF